MKYEVRLYMNKTSPPELYVVSNNGIEWYDEEDNTWRPSNIFRTELDLIRNRHVEFLGEL